MLKLIINIVLLFFVLNIDGQVNLVPNPSFEDTLQCPFNPGQVSFAPPWYDPTNASSDYFNACNNAGVGVPDNDGGNQLARTGKAYVGLYTYVNGFNYREYIQVQLLSVLSANNKYYVEFYISLADTISIAANNIGMCFSNTALTGPSGLVLNVIPQINNDITTNPLIDKNGWTKVSGTFVSNGTENYITIGNFLDDVNTDTIHVMGGNYPGAYYYIDDVSVVCIDCIDTACGELFVPDVFSPNGDNQNDVLKVYGNCISAIDFIVFDRWGEKVFETVDQNIGWDGIYNGKQLDDAVFVYYLKATVNGKEVVKQGNVAIIK